MASTMRVLNLHWLLSRRSQATQRPCRQGWLAVGLRLRSVDKDGRCLLPPTILDYESLFCIVYCFILREVPTATEPCLLGGARLESHYLSWGRAD